MKSYDLELRYSAPVCSGEAAANASGLAAKQASKAVSTYVTVSNIDAHDDTSKWLTALGDVSVDVLRFEVMGAAELSDEVQYEVHHFSLPIFLSVPPWWLRVATLGSFKLKLMRVRVLVSGESDVRSQPPTRKPRCTRPGPCSGSFAQEAARAKLL